MPIGVQEWLGWWYSGQFFDPVCAYGELSTCAHLIGCRYPIPDNGCKRFSRISYSSIGNTTLTGCFFTGCMTNEQKYMLSRRWDSRFDRKERSVTKAQEEDREKSGVDDSETPFFATVEFWLQAAIVVLTFGFVDAGYVLLWFSLFCELQGPFLFSKSWCTSERFLDW